MRQKTPEQALAALRNRAKQDGIELRTSVRAINAALRLLESDMREDGDHPKRALYLIRLTSYGLIDLELAINGSVSPCAPQKELDITAIQRALPSFGCAFAIYLAEEYATQPILDAVGRCHRLLALLAEVEQQRRAVRCLDALQAVA